MKRTRLMSMLALGSALLIAPYATADDAEAKPRPRGPLAGPRADGERGEKPQRGERPERGPRGEAGPARGLLEGIELTDEQKPAVREIFEEGAAARREWMEANKEKLEAIRAEMVEARKNRDREAAEAAMTKHRELMESGPKPGSVIEKVKAVLTAEQVKQLEANVAKMGEGRGGPGAAGAGPLAGALRGLDLSDEQEQKIKAILKDAHDSVDRDKAEAIQAKMKAAREAKDREAFAAAAKELRELHQSSHEPVLAKVKEVLTPEQVTKLDENLAKLRERGPRGEGEGRPRGGEGERGKDGERPRGPRGGERGGDRLEL